MCPLMCSFMVQYINPLSPNRYQHTISPDQSPNNFLTELAQVVQKLDSAIHLINHYQLDKILRDLSTGKRYPPFEQLGPG